MLKNIKFESDILYSTKYFCPIRKQDITVSLGSDESVANSLNDSINKIVSDKNFGTVSTFVVHSSTYNKTIINLIYKDIIKDLKESKYDIVRLHGNHSDFPIYFVADGEEFTVIYLNGEGKIRSLTEVYDSVYSESFMSHKSPYLKVLDSFYLELKEMFGNSVELTNGLVIIRNHAESVLTCLSFMSYNFLVQKVVVGQSTGIPEIIKNINKTDLKCSLINLKKLSNADWSLLSTELLIYGIISKSDVDYLSDTDLKFKISKSMHDIFMNRGDLKLLSYIKNIDDNSSGKFNLNLPIINEYLHQSLFAVGLTDNSFVYRLMHGLFILLMSETSCRNFKRTLGFIYHIYDWLCGKSLDHVRENFEDFLTIVTQSVYKVNQEAGYNFYKS